MSDTSFFAYNFNQLIDGTHCIGIDQILVNGQLRTRWTYGKYPMAGLPYMVTMSYVEGIGGLNGLIPVYHPCWSPPSTAILFCNYGNLTCFSVCGQTIYPIDSLADCPLISGLKELKQHDDKVNVFPALNEGTFTVDILEADLLPVHFTVYDITGREVRQLSLSQLSNHVSIESGNSGIYIWKAQSQGKFVQTGKMVVN